MDSETADPIDVQTKQMRETNSMVEEFMLVSNDNEHLDWKFNVDRVKFNIGTFMGFCQKYPKEFATLHGNTIKLQTL